MDTFRKANVYVRNIFAGVLSETDEGYSFSYTSDYLSRDDSGAVSLTLPLTEQTYTSKTLFPFFDGIIPEGWLLDVALRNTDISSLDRMSLLLLCCKDCIGAVSVVPENEKSDE